MKNNEEKTLNSFCLSLLVTFFFLIILWFLIGLKKYSIDVQYINNNFIFPVEQFYNNTGQNLQYIVTLLGFTVFFPIVYYFIRKKNIFFKKSFKLCDILLVLLLLFSTYILGFNVFTSIFLVLIFSILYFLFCKMNVSFNNIVVKKQNLIIYILIFYTCLLYIDKTFQQSFFSMHHVTAYYYPIHKVLNGLTLYVDFNSLYGGYCYVYAFIMKFFPQNLHLIVFSIITSLLVFISLFLTYRFLKIYIKDKKKVIFTFLSFLFCNIYFIYIIENSTYIQYMPHRYLSFIVMMNYVLYLKDKFSLKNILLGFIICSFMIFWNFDSGFIVTIAYLVFVIYGYIYNRKFLNIIFSILFFILSIFLSFLLIELLTYLKVGCFVSIKDILFSTVLFSNAGFMSLKLSIYKAPWILVLVGYLSYFGRSIVSLFDRDNFGNSLMCFLSVLGLGIFIYYIERSVIIKFVFIIVPLLFLLSNSETKRIKSLYLFISIIVSFVCLIFILVSFKYKFLSDIDQELRVHNDQLLSFSLDVGSENFEMYINCDTIYYELLGKRDMKRLPSYLDLFTKEDLNKLVDYIENLDKSIVVSFELVTSHYDYFLTDKIKNKYYIYYTYEKGNSDNYIYFIKKSDLKKIKNIDIYHKLDNLKLEELHG